MPKMSAERDALEEKIAGIRGAYDHTSQSLHDAGLELAEMKEWRRKYFDLERGHSATVDKLSAAIERIQLRERELSERSDLKVKAESERDALRVRVIQLEKELKETKLTEPK
jgi:hypothetical protein